MASESFGICSETSAAQMESKFHQGTFVTGMEQSKHDPVLFTHKQEGKVLGAIGVHIDDLMNSWFVDGLDGKLCNRF